MSYQRDLRTFAFKNATGETVPPFACMAITGATEEDNELVLSVRKPTTADLLLFNPATFAFNTGQNVPNNGTSRCTLDLPALAMVNGSVTAGDPVGPKNASWYLETTSYAKLFTAFAQDASNAFFTSSTLRTWLVKQATELNVACMSPSGGIAARSGSTLSSGSCTVYSTGTGSLSSLTGTIAVYNMSTTAISGSVYMIAARVGKIWVSIWEDC